MFNSIRILDLISVFVFVGHHSGVSQSKISWDTTYVKGVFNPTVYGTEYVSLWLRNNDTATVTITSLSVADTSSWNSYYGTGDSIPSFTIPAGDSTIVRFRFIARDTSLHAGILRATTASDTIYAIVRAHGRLPHLGFYQGASPPTSVQPDILDSVRLFLDPLDIDPFRPEGSDSLMLFFRQGGETDYQGWFFFNKVTTPNPNPPFDPIPLYWAADLPGTFGDISSTGYEFYVYLRIGAYVVTLPQSNAQSEPYKLTSILTGGVKKNDPQPIGTTGQQYKMISVPIFPDNESPAVMLSNFGVSDTTWKLLTWSNGDYIDSKSAGFPGLRPGRGYWFITKVADTLRTGPGQSTPLNNFGISLIPGWNMIGTPFNFAISWSDITGVPMNMVPYFWEGSEYSIRTTLYPWDGFFVQNEDPFNNITITVPPRRAIVSSTHPAFGFSKQLETGEWRIQVKAESGWMKDRNNYMGVLLTASDDLDHTDFSDAPKHPGNEYLQLRSVTRDGKALAGDFRSLSPDQMFEIEVLAKSAEGIVKVTWDNLITVPHDVTMYLIDQDARVAINLRQRSSYEFVVPKNTDTRRQFRLITGSVHYVENESDGVALVPERFHLYGNYPNPFNPVTTLRFDLPVAAHVTLTLYNSLGQRVARLLDKQMPAGTHTTLWNGRSSSGAALASGVYLARLEIVAPHSARLTATTKMILLK